MVTPAASRLNIILAHTPSIHPSPSSAIDMHTCTQADHVHHLHAKALLVGMNNDDDEKVWYCHWCLTNGGIRTGPMLVAIHVACYECDHHRCDLCCLE